jgi:hypothetical protein
MINKPKLIHISTTPLRTEGIFSRTLDRRSFTRHQRRALQRLSRAIDVVSEDDRVWFLRHPHRRLRLRPISRSEKEWSDVLGEHDRNYVIVQDVRPGMRSRHMISAFLFIDPDADDQQIASLWEQCEKISEVMS